MFPNAKIINISSTASINPTPGLTIYSATKAFIHHFTCVLATERENVLSHQCGFVDTAMLAGIRYKPYVIQPKDVAKPLIACLGNVTYTFGHIKHNIMGGFMKLLPASYTSHVILKKLQRKAN